MYLTSYDALQRALQERIRHQAEARERIDDLVRSVYGIDEAMTGVVSKCFGSSQEGVPDAILARQIASMCVEDVAFGVGARRIGLRPVVAPFTRDAFSCRNHDKLCRVKVPWISWSKKGNLVLAHERVSEASNEDLEGRPLDTIVCASGTTLPDFHQALRVRANVATETADVAALHSFMLERACRRPAFVFREVNGREERCELRRDEVVLPRDRPPASWYYLYYLSWFVDGSRVLFETYDNPVGEVSHARELFEGVMRSIAANTGFLPLVVKIPPLSKDMLYCNRHLLRQSASAELAERVPRSNTTDTVAFFRAIADAVIGFR